MNLKFITVLKEAIRVFLWTYFVLYLDVIGFSVIKIGYILSIGNFVYFIGYLLSGPLTDKLSASLALKLSLFIFFVSLLGMQFENFMTILFGFSLFNFAQSIGDVAIPILIESTKTRSSRVEFAIFSGLVSIGDAIILSLALFSLLFLSIVELFRYTLVLFGIVLLIMSRFVPKINFVEKSSKLTFNVFKEFSFESRAYLILATFQIAAVIFYWGYMALYAKMTGMSEIEWTISIILWFVVNALIYFIVVKFGLKVSYLPIYCVLEVLLCVLTLLKSPLLLILAFTLDATATAIYWPLHFEFVMVNVKEELRGTYLGLLYALRSVLMTIVYYVAAIIYEINPTFNIILASIIYAIFTIFVYPIFRKTLHE